MKPTRTTIEHRITWKREGNPPKSRRCMRRATVERFLALLGPEPWRAFGREPDDYFCCPGSQQDECGCRGVTVREEMLHEREHLPRIEWIKVESRMVERSAWVDTSPNRIVPMIAREDDALGALRQAVGGRAA